MRPRGGLRDVDREPHEEHSLFYAQVRETHAARHHPAACVSTCNVYIPYITCSNNTHTNYELRIVHISFCLCFLWPHWESLESWNQGRGVCYVPLHECCDRRADKIWRVNTSWSHRSGCLLPECCWRKTLLAVKPLCVVRFCGFNVPSFATSAIPLCRV